MHTQFKRGVCSGLRFCPVCSCEFQFEIKVHVQYFEMDTGDDSYRSVLSAPLY